MVAATDALDGFYTEEGLPDGGWNGAYIDWAKAFGVPVPIFNTRARLAALPYHDLHHLVTGYHTDEVGEGEISGWTLGTGGGLLFGELYDLGAFLLGFVRYPKRTMAAFWRGRQCRNFYHQPAAHWLGQDVAALKAYAGTDQPIGRVTPMDRIALARTVLTAALIWGTGLAVLLQLVVVAVDLAKGRQTLD